MRSLRSYASVVSSLFVFSLLVACADDASPGQPAADTVGGDAAPQKDVIGVPDTAADVLAPDVGEIPPDVATADVPADTTLDTTDGTTPPFSPQQGAVMVVSQAGNDELTKRIAAEAANTLAALVGVPTVMEEVDTPTTVPAIVALASAKGAGLVLVVDAQTVVPDDIGATEVAALPDDGFRIRTKDVGSEVNRLDGGVGMTVVLAAGSTRLGRQYAVYEVMRRLGVRYYHPEEEYVPRLPPETVRARAEAPTAVARPTEGGGPSEDYTPDFTHRSYSFHGAHPLEHLESFSDADFPIDEAVHVNDWMVKNRGDILRGAGRGIASDESRAKRAAELASLGKLLGLRGSTGITLHNQQQGASASIDPTSEVPVQQQIEEYVTSHLAAAPDAIHFGIHFGPTELTVTPDEETVQWIEWAGLKAKELRPDLPVIINDHITGSQPSPHFGDLGCPNGTNPDGLIDYYDLAFQTDPKLGVDIHTVMFYPLEGPANVYNQKSFAHKLCLMQKASAEGRLLWYFPEGSWWLSFDNPIPVYLPLYIWARGRDIELVRPLLASRGDGTLVGHRMFNSGQEWGYWQQDYAVGLWHWDADVTMGEVLGELFDPLCPPSAWPGSCAARDEGMAVLEEAMAFQVDTLLEREDFSGRAGGLYAYLAGEDPADVIAAQTGFEFRPVRLAFSKVLAFTDAQAAKLESGDLAALSEMQDAYAGWVDRLRAVEDQVPEPGLPWLHEVIDGLEIDGLRARQARELYEVVLAVRSLNAGKGTKDEVSALFEAAAQTLAAAEEVIARREQGYRYPAEQEYGGGLTPETAVQNGTTYPYRVHTKTHLLTYWHNRHDQVADIVEGKSDEQGSLVLDPVFAKPGVALGLLWPDGVDGELELGDGTTVDASFVSYVYEKAGVFAISGNIGAEDKTFPVSGAIARTDLLAVTAKGGLTLIEPASPIAQTVIGGLTPAFHWAVVPGGEDGPGVLAFAPDPGGDGKLDFRTVTRAAMLEASAGDFETAPTTFVLPVPDPATGDPAAQMTVKDAVLSGYADPGGLASPVKLTGGLVLADVVDALIALAGYDEKGAYQTLAGVLDFDPNDPPETVPLVATFDVVPQ